MFNHAKKPPQPASLVFVWLYNMFLSKKMKKGVGVTSTVTFSTAIKGVFLFYILQIYELSL